MSRLVAFIKEWMLVIGMVAGVLLYAFYHEVPALHHFGPAALAAVKVVQPVLIFIMLFLSFCRIAPKDLRLHRRHFLLLLIQGLSFVLLALPVAWASSHTGPLASFVSSLRIPLEAAMLCLICPTATACAVVVRKLGGDMAQAVTYTILVNIMVALLVPAVIPFLYREGEITFLAAFLRILAKVFPLLILPCLAAWLLRYLLPKLHAFLTGLTDLAFYIWAVSLTLAIMMSTRAIYHFQGSLWLLAGIALASLLSCIFQFRLGRSIGRKYGKVEEITLGQSLGQKNTVFAIWMGYTFMEPIVSVAGGFYSIWHNLYNSWQLHKQLHQQG
ncbi:MAG: transporter [Candidatus Cryptobacteroides sp.]